MRAALAQEETGRPAPESAASPVEVQRLEHVPPAPGVRPKTPELMETAGAVVVPRPAAKEAPEVRKRYLVPEALVADRLRSRG